MYFEEPNVFLLRKKKHCTSEYEMILQEENVGKIASRDFSLLENNSFHLVLGDKAGYIWIEQTTQTKRANVCYIMIFMEIHIAQTQFLLMEEL